MWRNRSTKAVTSKQAIMADQIPLLSLTKSPSNTSISSLISPRFFNGLLTNNHQDSGTALISPKSILDTKNSSPPSAANNPFDFVENPSKPRNISNKPETEAIGLALIDSLNQEKKSENSCNPINRMALFGSNLKVQIPAPVEVGAPRSPLDFGIKTRNSHLLGVSPDTPAREFSRQLSLKEMEQSEDYTCVITHGPNPKTTHIFDDCIVESCIGEHVLLSHHNNPCAFQSTKNSFVSFCHSCKESTEKACCSHECQFEERDFEGTKIHRDDSL